MPKPPIFNYLRTHRKRLGLSQKELAALLGAQSGAKICRYERVVREPTFKAAIAFELVFQRPLRELFKGLYREIASEITPRAKKLLAKHQNLDSKGATHKLAVISKLLTALSSH
jgi:transcriptional regulator with XRE-family HTH domain